MAPTLFQDLTAAHNGDKASMEMLLQKYAPLINGTAWHYLRTQKGMEKEDATSIFTLLFIETVKKFDPENLIGHSDAEITAYFKAVMHNSMCKKIVKDKREVCRIPYSDLSDGEKREADVRSSETDEYTGITQNELRAVLSPEEYSIVTMLVNGDAKTQDVAARLHISRQTVCSIKKRAYAKLSKLQEGRR